MMEIQILTSIKELESIRERWNALLSQSVDDVVHLKYEWFISGVECFHPGDDLYVIHVVDATGTSIAIAPLIISTGPYRKIKVRKLSFLNNPQTPFNDFIIRKGHVRDAIRIIFDHLVTYSGWELIDLQKVYSHGEIPLLIKETLSASHSLHGIKDSIESPYVCIEGAWEQFMAQKSTRFKKSLRNKINKAERAGSVAVEEVCLEDSRNPAVESLFRISGNSWKKEIGNDLLSREANRSFYRKICDCFGPQGLVTLWLFLKNRVPVAFEFHLTYNGVAYPIRADYDEAFRDLSPGSILEFNILKTLFTENRVREYNSCGHTYKYLLNWSNNTRKFENLEVFKKSFKTFCLYALEYELLPFLRKMKINALVHFIKNGGEK